MKRKYKKTKKGHMRKNATIKRKKHIRRQRGGAFVTNIEQPDDNFVRNGQNYNVIEADYDDSGLPKYMFIGQARAIITHQTCGVGADAFRQREPGQEEQEQGHQEEQGQQSHSANDDEQAFML